MAGASASAIKGGEAFVSLFINDSALKRGLDSASKDLKSWGKGLAMIGGGAAGIGGVFLAPIVAGLTDFLSYAGEVRGLSTRLGQSVEDISALGYAASTAGLDFDTLETSMRFFQKAQYAARSGSEEAQKALAVFGLTAENLAGLPLVEQVKMLSDGFKHVDDEVTRTGAGVKILGRSGSQAFGLLKLGSEELEARLNKAGRVGATLTKEQTDEAKKFSLSMKELAATARFAFMELGKALIPAFGQMIGIRGEMQDVIIGVRQWIAANGSAVISIFKIASVVSAAGVAIVALGGGVIFLGSVLGTLMPVITAVVAAMVSWPGVVAAVGAGLALLWAGTDRGSETIIKLAADWETAWGGILASVKAGDLAGAFDIAFMALKITWTALWGDLRKEFDDFLSYVASKASGKEKKTTAAGLLNDIMAAGDVAGELFNLWGTQLWNLDLKAGQEEFNKNVDRIRADWKGTDEELKRMEKEPAFSDDAKLKAMRDEMEWKVMEAGMKEAFGALNFGERKAGDRKAMPDVEAIMTTAARGAFAGSGNLEGQFAFGPMGDRIAKATERTADATEDIADGMDGGTLK